MTSFRSRPAVITLAIVFSLATAASAGAQTTTTPPPTSPPTTAAPSPTTTPTTTCFLLCPGPTTPTTAEPGPTKAPATTTPGAPGSPPTTSPSLGGDGEPPVGTPKVVPPDAQRLIDSVRRTGPNNTEGWMAAIQPLVIEFGLSTTDAALAAGGRFPIAGPTTWVDDWHYPRFTPSFHLHKGLDMFAASGTPVRAPFDGVLKQSEGAVGGLASYITQPDGTYVYLAHLSAFAADKPTGMLVKTGDVVGYVGDSGNARGGAPHVHIQIHPRGGEPVPPKPTVDAWLAEAAAGANGVIEARRAAKNPPVAAGPSASVTPVPQPNGTSVDTVAAVDPAAALWAASSNPAIGTIDLASSLVASAADGIDWPKPPT